MVPLIQTLVAETVSALDAERNRRFTDGGPALPHTRIRLLGQLSLFADEELSSKLTLFATQDCDAVIEGDWAVKSLFREVLKRNNLAYDELSNEVWIPEETEWGKLHESPWLTFDYSKPPFTILSKAVKSPEKNKTLIRVAAELYGPPLTSLLKKYNVPEQLWR